MNTRQIESIKSTISEVFAMPERKQAAMWVVIIEYFDGNINNPAATNKEYNESIEARDIFISIASEAKYFG